MNSAPRLPDDSVNLGDQRPVRDIVQLFAGITVVVVGLVVVIALATDVAVGFISRDTEKAIFAPVLDTIRKSVGGSDATKEANEALRELFDRVHANTESLPYEFDVRVTCYAVPNALALPGGGILVTSGLLKVLHSENELAFVLGHELGHFEHRDHLRGLGRGLVVAVALGLVGSAASAEVVANISNAALAAHNRGQETDADLVGVGAIVGMYGHAAGAMAVMTALSEASHEDFADRVDILRSHPVSDDRKQAMRELMQERNWRSNGKLRPLADALQAPCAATPTAG